MSPSSPSIPSPSTAERPARPASSGTAPQAPLVAWTPPRVTCLAARPEISAYSGDANPWPSSR